MSNGHNGTVFCVLCPKISTGQEKLAPTGRYGWHVFATLDLVTGIAYTGVEFRLLWGGWWPWWLERRGRNMLMGRTTKAPQGATALHRCTVRSDQFGFLATLIRFLQEHAEAHQVRIVALLWLEKAVLQTTNAHNTAQALTQNDKPMVEWRWIPA